MRRLRLCLRLRGGRPLERRPGNPVGPSQQRQAHVPQHEPDARPDLPSRDQAARLANSLAGLRGKASRRVQIGLRKRVLEVGCGHGIVTQELARRCGGEVVALDRDTRPFAVGQVTRPVSLVEGDAAALPFAHATCDLVFSQNVLLWVPDLQAAVAEAARVLTPGGWLVAIEPDYGGMVEHPDLGLRAVWLESLTAAGADPCVGRKLPGAFETAGLRVFVELQNIPAPASAEDARLLFGLPLTDMQRTHAEEVARALSAASGAWQSLLHVPYFLVIGHKPA